MQRYSIVEPVSKSRTNNQEFLEETRDAASNTWWAVLSNVNRRNAGHATDTETSDETTTIDLADMVKRSDLDDCTDHEDDGETQKRVLATEPVVEDGCEDCAEETACCEQGNNVLGDVGVGLAGESGGGCWQSEVRFEALEGENGAHNTSVIACLGA